LIADYLDAAPLDVPDSQFMRNADVARGCDSGILEWYGCGEQDPINPTTDAFRPNRRTELLFVNAATLPCQLAQPETFQGAWCLGGGDPNHRCCFISRNGAQNGGFPLVPAETGGTFTVTGSVTAEGVPPLGSTKYFVIAPDGQFIYGEFTGAPNRGRPIPTRLQDDGTFVTPTIQKGPGVYSLTVLAPVVLRLAGDPPGSGKGNTVCARLDGSAPFAAIASPV
jgi:hypothetical protein